MSAGPKMCSRLCLTPALLCPSQGSLSDMRSGAGSSSRTRDSTASVCYCNGHSLSLPVEVQQPFSQQLFNSWFSAILERGKKKKKKDNNNKSFSGSRVFRGALTRGHGAVRTGRGRSSSRGVGLSGTFPPTHTRGAHVRAGPGASRPRRLRAIRRGAAGGAAGLYGYRRARAEPSLVVELTPTPLPARGRWPFKCWPAARAAAGWETPRLQ